jgi:anti-sigma B factor antagonist
VRIETIENSERTLISVEGDVDLDSSPELRSAVLKAVPTATTGVWVHLGGVSYMDSSGVATLVEGLRSARKHDKSFVLVAPSIAVMKVLELARLDSIFEVKTTR